MTENKLLWKSGVSLFGPYGLISVKRSFSTCRIRTTEFPLGKEKSCERGTRRRQEEGVRGQEGVRGRRQRREWWETREEEGMRRNERSRRERGANRRERKE